MKRLICTSGRIKLVADIERSQLGQVLEAVEKLEMLVSKQSCRVMWDLVECPTAEMPAPVSAKKGVKK